MQEQAMQEAVQEDLRLVRAAAALGAANPVASAAGPAALAATSVASPALAAAEPAALAATS
eukprot:scaffold9391_cov52-Phaeocystis_antarctica.AAC.4